MTKNGLNRGANLVVAEQVARIDGHTRLGEVIGYTVRDDDVDARDKGCKECLAKAAAKRKAYSGATPSAVITCVMR